MKTFRFLVLVIVSLAAVPFARGAAPTGGTELVFSNKDVFGETGDCGGFDLHLLRGAEPLTGSLSVFEGNCGDALRPITVTAYDPATGTLRFRAAEEDLRNEKNEPVKADYYWTFAGTWKGDVVDGTFEVHQSKDDSVTHSQKAVLKKRAR